MEKKESEAVRWNREMELEKKQCRFYPHCNKKPVATLTIDKEKYRVCLECAGRFKKENEEKLLEVKHGKK